MSIPRTMVETLSVWTAKHDNGANSSESWRSFVELNKYDLVCASYLSYYDRRS